MKAYKLGAIFYALWGIMHVVIGVMLLSSIMSGNPLGALSFIGSGLPEGSLSNDVHPLVSAILGQHAWNLLWFGLFSTTVAVTLNWKNSRAGYWINLIVVSAADIGFLFAIFIPGYIKFTDGIMGPIFWILAVIFSTIGYMGSKNEGAATVRIS